MGALLTFDDVGKKTEQIVEFHFLYHKKPTKMFFLACIVKNLQLNVLNLRKI